jgi:Domain of unknown function (DUF4160)
MVTVHREGGFRIVIHTDDHLPAHVHVIKDGEVVIQLVGRQGNPELMREIGSTNADVRKSMRIVEAQQASLLERWKEIHGDPD